MRTAFLFLILFSSCKTNNKVIQANSNQLSEFKADFNSGPPTLVYKTKANYDNLVPVILSADKSEIVAYPHPNDLKTGNIFQRPTPLKNGYLLDNRGIGKNVAFLKITYEEYFNLSSALSLREMYNMILDKDPLEELCDCGNKNTFNNITEQINTLIENKQLKITCKVVK